MQKAWNRAVWFVGGLAGRRLVSWWGKVRVGLIGPRPVDASWRTAEPISARGRLVEDEYSGKLGTSPLPPLVSTPLRWAWLLPAPTVILFVWRGKGTKRGTRRRGGSRCEYDSVCREIGALRLHTGCWGGYQRRRRWCGRGTRIISAPRSRNWKRAGCVPKPRSPSTFSERRVPVTPWP